MNWNAINEEKTMNDLSALVTELADALEEANKSAHNLKWQDWRDLIQKSRNTVNTIGVEL